MTGFSAVKLQGKKKMKGESPGLKRDLKKFLNVMRKLKLLC